MTPHEHADTRPHDHAHAGPHAHGHQLDRGPRGLLRYLRQLPRMWTSEVNREVVRQLAPTTGEVVVDLGAGMGAGAVEAARRGATVVAIDPTPYMRRILRARRWLERRSPSVRVVDGAAESLPLPDATVDALFTVNTIHHWTDRNQAARELARVVKTGGRVLLVDEDFDDPSHPFHERWRTANGGHGHVFEPVEPSEIAAALERNGFATSSGARERIAGRPAKIVRATR